MTTSPMKIVKQRESNMELFRIVLMLMIMILHADFASLGGPSVSDIKDNPVSSFERFFIEILTLPSVNAFILISGYYEIHPSVHKIIGLLFQVLFFSIPLYVYIVITHSISFSFKELYGILNLSNYWFVNAYIVLYVISPILNQYVNHSTKKMLGSIIVSLLVLQVLWGWSPGAKVWYDWGYSPLCFITLYLLGRYIKLYWPESKEKPAYIYIIAYLVLSLSIGLLAILFSLKGGFYTNCVYYLFTYISPFTIVLALFLFFIFKSIRFSSRIINWIASSSFAVYLLHNNSYFFRHVYLTSVQNWYNNLDSFSFVFNTFLFIVIIFLISIGLDKFRFILWNYLSSRCVK